MSDDDARHALVALLARHLATLPADLALAFRFSSGIASDAPFLTERLEALEVSLQRSSRVIRRRIRDADELLTDAILAENAESDSALADRGWQWVEQDLRLTLRSDATLELRRTLRSLTDSPRVVNETFVIPHSTGVAADWTIETIDGFESCTVDASVEGRWDLTLSLPAGLSRGREVETRLVVRASDARTLEPYFVLAPLRHVRRLAITVDVGRPASVAEAWLIRAAMPYSMQLADLKRESLDLDQHSEATITVNAPRAGLVYGVGWRWHD